MTPDQHPARLTAADRNAINRAYQLAGLKNFHEVREYTDQDDAALAYAGAFGEAQHLLRILAAIAEQQDVVIGNMPADRAEG